MLHQDLRIEDESCNIRYVCKSQAMTNPERHFHNSWEILYVASGHRTFFHKSDTYNMNEGAIALIPPGILHRGLNRGSETCELVNIYVLDPNNSLFLSCLPLFQAWIDQFDPVIQVDDKNRYEIEALFSDIELELTQKDDWYVESTWSLISILLIKICRFAKTKIGNVINPISDSTISPILKWLDTHYQSSINLRRVAKEANMSPSYFSRLFYKTTQIHFNEYLSYIRVQRACALLATSDNPIYYVAEVCGFTSVTHFGRVFRKLTGQRPLEYRKKTNPRYHI